MKIIAHSIVPVNPIPYMHLGYTSAAPMNFAGPMFSLMLIWIAIAAYVWKKSLTWGIVCIVLAVISLGSGLFNYERGKKYQTRHQTESISRKILRKVYDYEEIGKSIPADIKEMNDNPQEPFLDGWSHPFRFSKNVDKRGEYYLLTSSGPDGKFDTDDDITTRRNTLHQNKIDSIKREKEKTIYNNQQNKFLTQENAKDTINELIEYDNVESNISFDLKKLEEKTGYTRRDAWNNSFHVVKHKDNKTVYYKLISNGPDGKFGTNDDVVTILKKVRPQLNKP